MKDLYNEDFKTIKKRTEEEIRKWKDLSCFCVSRVNVMKMAES